MRRKSACSGAGQRAREDGLADSGDVFQEHVAAGEERGHDGLDRRALAEEDALDVFDELEEDGRGRHAAAILTISPPNARTRTRRAGP